MPSEVVKQDVMLIFRRSSLVPAFLYQPLAYMPFTPVNTLIGGALLHLSTSSLLGDTGHVLGISGITESALFGSPSISTSWQKAVIGGLLVGPTIAWATGVDGIYAGDALAGWSGIGIGRASLAGMLVGFGSRLGSGCTSGHFLCGVSRGSKRSLIATASFFSAALFTAAVTSTPSTRIAGPEYIPIYPKSQQLVQLLFTSATLYLAQTALRRYLTSVNIPNRLQRLSPYFLSGITFSFGLLLSGMADPRKVLQFLIPLDTQNFDPSLAMVVLSGVIPNTIHWIGLKKGQVSFKWEKWAVPSRTDIDWKLVLGSVIFGIGWGLAGVCPGPAIVGVGRLVSESLAGNAVGTVGKIIGSYFASMVAGMAAVRYLL